MNRSELARRQAWQGMNNFTESARALWKAGTGWATQLAAGQ